jgi:hypothetical protein
MDWDFLTITLKLKGSLQRRDRLCNVRLLRRHCGDCGWRFALRRMCAEAQLELRLRGCVICPAFVLLLHRHQTALPHEFDSTAIIWQVKGSSGGNCGGSPPTLTIIRNRATSVTLPSQARPGRAPSHLPRIAFSGACMFLHSGQVVTKREQMVFWPDIANVLALFPAVFPARVSILAIEPNWKDLIFGRRSADIIALLIAQQVTFAKLSACAVCAVKWEGHLQPQKTPGHRV